MRIATRRATGALIAMLLALFGLAVPASAQTQAAVGPVEITFTPDPAVPAGEYNLWVWPTGGNGVSMPFTGKDAAGNLTASIPVPEGKTTVNVIVRRSTSSNEWEWQTADFKEIVGTSAISATYQDKENFTLTREPDPSIAKPTPAEPGKCMALHTKEFNDKYAYDGELGALYSPASTTFRLWAPTAVSVNLLNDTTGKSLPMTAGEKGTWEYTLAGDQAGTVYRYELTFEDGTVNVSSDPYARASTANSAASVVVDSAKTVPAGWSAKRVAGLKDRSQAVIYEAHVRDLTIRKNNGITNKGKFLGVVEKGTRTAKGNPSGLDYLKGLGVTHVQLLPMYDFASIDETGDLSWGAQYNWGYDPANYNVPEGSYSTDPKNPTSRIVEMKQMVQGLHDAGLHVIMDVVYNHVFDTAKSPLELTVPGYYFRMTNECGFQNGTGVGNETASEQPMMRKFIVDSVKYWASEYNLDGFRFDLMGIHDVETMNQVRAALDQIDPNIIVLGEGWEMGNHPKGVVPSNYRHPGEIPGISHFNDAFRDAMKGSVFDAKAAGFASGSNSEKDAARVYDGVLGSPEAFDFAAPYQSVVYNEAHDNFTLYDKLKATSALEGAPDSEIARRHALATTVQALSQGTLFVHAGQEFLRTKGGDENSYKSPDKVNELDYDRAATYPGNEALFKGLVALRAKSPWLHIASYEEIANRIAGGAVDGEHIAYEVKDAFGKGASAWVFVNGSKEAWNADLVAGEYGALIKDAAVPASPVKVASDGTVEVEPLSVLLVGQWDAVAPAVVPSQEPSQSASPEPKKSEDPASKETDPQKKTDQASQKPNAAPNQKQLSFTGSAAGVLAVVAGGLVLAGAAIAARRKES
ncbi:type I pullulanase [Arcanobacterium wilhelmae]|uniref:type I pullulanase n=1 Tax=Arcanobacterium wilhelmae TaxID=1803177 RepID=UPI002414DAEB|nr:type I pullulanase [Arcanobacterium wilhelmae]WFN89854.1 type I pullulanase [Arcanobacterium wilhelmae]